MQATVAANIWMHTRGRPHAFAALAGANAAFWTAMFVGVERVPQSPANHVLLAFIFIGVAAPSAWLAVRTWRAGLRLTAGAAGIKGPLKDRSVPLDQIAAFKPGVQSGVGNGTPCVVLHCVDGRELGVWALGREGWVFRYGDYMSELQPVCDDLNALLHSLRAPAS